MFFHIPLVLAQIKSQLTKYLQDDAIVKVFRDAGMCWRIRVLDPLTTLRLFVLQILHGNTAINQLRHFHSRPFTDSAYCQARSRLPLAVLQQLLHRLVAALQPLMNDGDGRWLGHRTFHVDGSTFSMPDTPELQLAFGQPDAQKPGCGFPVAHVLTLFHAKMGFLLHMLAAPYRTHDMSQVAQMHPELEPGDVLIGDRAFCSYCAFSPALPAKNTWHLSNSSASGGRFPTWTRLQQNGHQTPEGLAKLTLGATIGLERSTRRMVQTQRRAGVDER